MCRSNANRPPSLCAFGPQSSKHSLIHPPLEGEGGNLLSLVWKLLRQGEDVDAVIAAGHVRFGRHPHLETCHPAAARGDGNVLAPIDRIGDGAADGLRWKPRLPDDLAVVG